MVRSLFALAPLALLVSVPFISPAASSAQAAHAMIGRSGGIFGYSGNPAHNAGQICTSCHGGGSVPTVTLEGPTLVQAGKAYTYSLLVSGGQQDHGGLGVSVTDGALADTTGETRVDGNADELTHSAKKPADANGDVRFEFEWTAPALSGALTMYGSGNSVNNNFSTSGDSANKDELAITVEDCLVDWTQYGDGTAGSGGFVPNLDGIDGPCAGGSSMEITDGLGGARGWIWISDGEAMIPFFGGNILVDITSLWIRIPIKLGGTKGVAGAGSLSLPAGDLSFAAGFTFYLQTLFIDSAAVGNVSLSNGLRLDIGV